MATNKVVYGGQTLMDLTSDTVTPETLAEGVTAHSASGEQIVGIMTVNNDGIPEYVAVEAETVADLILEKMNAGCLVGAFVSDIHLENNQAATETSITHAGMGIGEIRKIVPFDFVANLGDNCETEDAHKFIYKALYNAILGTTSFWLRGNHEGSAYNYSNDVGYEYLVTDDEVYKYVGVKNKGHVINADDRKGMYGYKDFEDLRLRIIYLNTSETFENQIGDAAVSVVMTAAQVDWLQNTALNFTAKADANKWKVLVLSHVPLDWNASTQQAVSVLDTYNSSGNGAKIVGNIHGHTHNCNVGTIGTSKIARIAIPQICADPNRCNEYSSYGSSYAKWGEFADDGTTPIYYYKGTGNATDTMFCVVVIDCENEKFYAITFGATTAITKDGSYTKSLRVREVTFTGESSEEGGEGGGTDTPDVPDVPDVPDEPENIIDTVGYTDNARVSSSGSLKTDASGAGYVSTGLIPWGAVGDVYKATGVSFNADSYGYCIVTRYKDAGVTVWENTYPTSANMGKAIAGMQFEREGADGLKITITAAQPSTYCFRLCGYGSGANLVVTKNA